MARIRTIKPEFFRHSGLQELEALHPKLRPMLVFAGLWCHCDRNGTFRLDPRQLALDILPFVWGGPMGEAIEKAITILTDAGMVCQFEREGKRYGFIPTFSDHQRITGTEANSKMSRYPEPPENISILTQGNTEETPRKFTPPTAAEVADYCSVRGNLVDAEKFIDFYTAKGWVVGKNQNPMKDWQAAVRTWEKSDNQAGQQQREPEMTEAQRKANAMRLEEAERILGQ